MASDSDYLRFIIDQLAKLEFKNAGSDQSVQSSFKKKTC